MCFVLPKVTTFIAGFPNDFTKHLHAPKHIQFTKVPFWIFQVYHIGNKDKYMCKYGLWGCHLQSLRKTNKNRLVTINNNQDTCLHGKVVRDGVKSELWLGRITLTENATLAGREIMFFKQSAVGLAHDTGVRGQAKQVTQVKYDGRVKRGSPVTLPEMKCVKHSCF